MIASRSACSARSLRPSGSTESGSTGWGAWVRRASIATLATTAAVVSVSACLGDDPTAVDVFQCQDRESFINYVSPVMELRCGGLDCHGHLQRPMRLYSRYGLRLIDPAVPALADLESGAGLETTREEREWNYAAVCNVEPTKMDDAVANLGVSASELLLIRKARGEEQHKGGHQIAEGDLYDQCITGWASAATSEDVCIACRLALGESIADCAD